MHTNQRFSRLISLLHQRPHAAAILRGSPAYPELFGSVGFYQSPYGVFVAAEVRGLPIPAETCGNHFFGFHIHSGGSCSGNDTDPFADALGHYNPQNCPHPSHAGDLPPLLGNQGYACQLFLTDHFTVSEIIDKTVIIHAGFDDFSTQPSGNAGTKIACGLIRGWNLL